MFGYATDETEECMPLTVVLSHKLNARLAALRRSGEISWARPDSKTQVIYYLKFKLEPLRSNRVQRLLEICMYFSTVSRELKCNSNSKSLMTLLPD